MADRRESFLDVKCGDVGQQADKTVRHSSTNQQSASATVRGSDDSGFEDVLPVVDQNYSAASGLSLVRRTK